MHTKIAGLPHRRAGFPHSNLASSAPTTAGAATVVALVSGAQKNYIYPSSTFSSQERGNFWIFFFFFLLNCEWEQPVLTADFVSVK